MIDLDEKQTTTGIIYIHCLDKIKELSADYSHADALDYCAAEASCALFCLTDAVLSLAGVDSRVTCETMYTTYSSSSELLKFYDDGTYYMGHTLELWRQSGGNFNTHSIDESDFPG